MRFETIATAVLAATFLSACSSEHYDKIDDLATEKWREELLARDIHEMSLNCWVSPSPSGTVTHGKYKVRTLDGIQDGDLYPCPSKISGVEIKNMPDKTKVTFTKNAETDEVSADAYFEELTYVVEKAVQDFDERKENKASWE